MRKSRKFTKTISASSLIDILRPFSDIAGDSSVARFETENGRMVWMATHSLGDRELEYISGGPTRTRAFVSQFGMGGGWRGCDPADIRFLRFGSVNGSALEFVLLNESEGVGELKYVPPAGEPDYKGRYFAAWASAPDFVQS